MKVHSCLEVHLFLKYSAHDMPHDRAFAAVKGIVKEEKLKEKSVQSAPMSTVPGY